jgi:hypothetical protein
MRQAASHGRSAVASLPGIRSHGDRSAEDGGRATEGGSSPVAAVVARLPCNRESGQAAARRLPLTAPRAIIGEFDFDPLPLWSASRGHTPNDAQLPHPRSRRHVPRLPGGSRSDAGHAGCTAAVAPAVRRDERNECGSGETPCSRFVRTDDGPAAGWKEWLGRTVGIGQPVQ